MDGFALARWIGRNRPDVKVVMTSALERSANLAADLREHRPLLEKPYHEKLLLERIHRALAVAKRPRGATSAA